MTNGFTDKFAPLEMPELEISGTTSAIDYSEGELVTTIPWDAPSPPLIHTRHGEAIAHWTYLNSEGEEVFRIVRFEFPNGHKAVLPQTLWKARDGKLEWRWKAMPSPRPLYRLNELKNKPNASVIIVEGEKAADAAALVFKNSAVITSSGGANAASKTDWNPLKGRRVRIWPDNDNPGTKYATEVAVILSELGCELSVVGSAKLASINPDGTTREPPESWDAADAVDEWSDLDALRRAVNACAAPFTPSPVYISFGQFQMTDKGLTISIDKKGNSDGSEQHWVAAPFEVLGASRDPKSSGWGKWLRWRDKDEHEHTLHVQDAALQGDPAGLCATLAGHGLAINRNKQRALAQYLSSCDPPGRATLVVRTGWHDVGGRQVFVLPARSIGAAPSESVILDTSAKGPYEERGSLQEWRDGVGKLSVGHVLPIFSIAIAFAGPLLHLAGQEGGGINIFGPSSTGKSTLLQIAGSVWGRGSSPGYVRAWRATANGLEGAAASASDTVLILDELGTVEPREAAGAIYGLGNGSGKQRAGRTGELREPKTWRVLTLSSGEVPLEAKLSEDRGRKARAGQMVRMLDVAADRGLGFGAFDHAGSYGSAGKLADAFKQAAISSYGVAGPAFIEAALREGVQGETVRSLIADFVDPRLPQGADGQIQRAAQRFGLIAVAGELAIAFEIVPWTKGSATEAASWALERYIDQRGGAGPAEVRQAIEQVRAFIESHGQSRFEDVDADELTRTVHNRAGWRRKSGSAAEWLCLPEVWKREICQGIDPKLAARVLAEAGMLQRSTDGFQVVVKINGVPRRVYQLNAKIMAGVDHDA